MAQMAVPARFVPSFRVCQSAERGVRTNILFKMHGGLGDIVCAEPAVRYAMTHFKGLKFSLLTLYPGLFQHLEFDAIYDDKNFKDCDQAKYLIYENTDTGNELAAEFVCHTLMHGIDYASLYMWRMVLPNKDKEILLVPTTEERAFAASLSQPNDVLVHPGKTWKSRTFPKKWWDSVIQGILEGGGRPVIIGGDIDNGRANTVEVDVPEGCVDLRFKLSLMQSTALMHQSKVVLTNDSAPLHMATTGDSWIGFVSTVKHSDHMYAYRKGELGWRMKDFALDNMYNGLDVCPNKETTIRVDGIDIQDLLSWLPDPKVVSDWALSKL